MGQANAIDRARAAMDRCYGANKSRVAEAQQDWASDAEDAFQELHQRKQRCIARLEKLKFFEAQDASDNSRLDSLAPSHSVQFSGYSIGMVRQIDEARAQAEGLERLDPMDSVLHTAKVKPATPRTNKPAHGVVRREFNQKQGGVPTDMAVGFDRKPAQPEHPTQRVRKPQQEKRQQSQRIGGGPSEFGDLDFEIGGQNRAS